MTTDAQTPTGRLPVLFIGHGSPMNAIEDNPWSRAFKALGGQLPKPRALLSVSAHWYVEGTYLTSGEKPRTIHDFGGFPRKLYEMQYPARGDDALAKRVMALVSEPKVGLRSDWGLDHGTWSVLCHLRPAADVPVVQLSIDARLAPARHVELGRALAPLRDEGVLIMGSGNATHNLRHAMMSYQRGDRSTPAWASRFDTDLASATAQHDTAFLAKVMERDDFRMSHPTPDHYLPLLYAAGAADAKDKVRYPVEGFDLGSLSMRSVLFG